MERSDWDDDDGYPPAPLPAHERQWRHPSEVGTEAWARTEPPLAIGRGLSVATGVVGVVLATAMMLTMLPTGAGRNPGVAARSTITALAVRSASTPTTLAQATGTEPASSGTPDAAFTTADGATSSAVASSAEPVPTFRVTPHIATEPVAVAVAVHEGRLVVTTANAVRANSVELLTPGGELRHATVLVLDERSGLAVLAPDAGSAAGSFVLAPEVADGDVLTVMAEEPQSVTVGPGGLADASCGDTVAVVEGTPVVDSAGNLVALCTATATGSRMIGLNGLDELRRALGAAVDPTVWMGVVLNDDPTGALVVGALEPDGPAAAAGLDVGDTILAFEGEPVADLAELAGLLALHQPGDIVAVQVACPDGTSIEVLIELAPPRAAL